METGLLFIIDSFEKHEVPNFNPTIFASIILGVKVMVL